MATNPIVRRAALKDAKQVNALLSEWLDWRPSRGSLPSIKRAIANDELLVAVHGSRIIGFIHYAMHEDIIDGGPNAFITAFYVSPAYRGRGTGTLLLKEAVGDSLSRGALGIETSTLHSDAKKFYEKNHFRQAFFGDIGEVFLELDADEYLKARKLGRPSSDPLPPASS